MVVLAQLAPRHGFQIKWALEFPGAPLGAIEYILTHVIKKLGDAGVKTATFGAGATGKLQAVENVHGFRVKTLEKAYNGLSATFNLGGKGDFRSKFGTWHDPVSGLLSRRCGACWGRGLTLRVVAVHLLPEGRPRHEGHRGHHGDAAEAQVNARLRTLRRSPLLGRRYPRLTGRLA